MRNDSKRLLARSLLFLSESTQIHPTMVFFLSLFSRNFDDRLSPNFDRLVIFMHMMGIHQMRRLVFDNYQRCTFPLKPISVMPLFGSLACKVVTTPQLNVFVGCLSIWGLDSPLYNKTKEHTGLKMPEIFFMDRFEVSTKKYNCLSGMKW